MTMKITMENIGGITKPITVNLKEGLNIIKAPNATGKTSFIHSLQTLVLPEKELKQHTEFLNDFSNEGIVKLDNGKESTTRKLTRVGTELGVVGKPFYKKSIGLKASLLTFSDPDNKFLNAILQGESLDKFFDEFSDVKYYKQLEILSKEKDYLLAKDLMEYRGLIENLEKKEKGIKELNKKLEKLNNERDNIEPAYNDLLKGKHDKKLNEYNKYRVSRGEIYSQISELKLRIENYNLFIPNLKDEIKTLEEDLEEFNKAHPKYNKEMDNMVDEITSLNKKEEQIENEIENLKDQIESTDKKGKGDICWECGKPFSIKERKQRLSKLNDQLDEKTKEELKIRQRREELELNLEQLKEKTDKIFDKNAKEIEYKQRELNTNKQKLYDDSESFEKKQKSIKTLEKQMDELKKDLDKRTTQILEDLRNNTESLGNVKGQIKSYEKEIEFMKLDVNVFRKLQSKADFIKKLIAHLKQKIKEFKDIVKDKFNKKIMEVYKILQYKDFESIEIDDMFKITVRRKKDGRTTTQELNRLSTSERVTIGVIVMLAGKEEYLPDFPFFVLDEVTTAYDPKRFEKIIDYIQKQTPYTIVTTFSSTGDKIQVEHKK